MQGAYSSQGGSSKGPMAGTKLGGGYKQGQMQQFTPEQMQLFQQQFGQVSPESFTSRLAGGDQSVFDQMEAPAMRQFQELQGGLASRFSGAGMGARRGSGFKNASNQATSDFAQQLQSNRLALQQQAIRDLSGMSNNLLGQRPYENFAIAPKEKKPKWWQNLIAGVSPIAGAAIGGVTGGPMGAKMGYEAGSQFGQAFQ